MAANLLRLRDALAARGLSPVGLAHLWELAQAMGAHSLSESLGLPRPVMSRAAEQMHDSTAHTAASAPADASLAFPSSSKPKKKKKTLSADASSSTAASSFLVSPSLSAEQAPNGAAPDTTQPPVVKPRKGRPSRAVIEARLAAASAALGSGNGSSDLIAEGSVTAAAVRLPHRFRNTVDATESLVGVAGNEGEPLCDLCSQGMCDFRISPSGPSLHAACLARCPRVLQKSQRKWWNLRQTVQLASRTKCSQCTSKAAAVYCVECGRAYHVKCADPEGFCFPNEPRGFLCAMHRVPCSEHSTPGCFVCSPALETRARRMVLKFAGDSAACLEEAPPDLSATPPPEPSSVEGDDFASGGGGSSDVKQLVGKKKERVRMRNRVDVVDRIDGDGDSKCELCGGAEQDCDLSVRPHGPALHSRCLLKCPRVLRLSATKWYNISLTLDKAKETACAQCQGTMAPITCIVCMRSWHLRCAEAEGFAFPKEPRAYLCAEHRVCPHSAEWTACEMCSEEFAVMSSRVVYKFASKSELPLSSTGDAVPVGPEVDMGENEQGDGEEAVKARTLNDEDTDLDDEPAPASRFKRVRTPAAQARHTAAAAAAASASASTSVQLNAGNSADGSADEDASPCTRKRQRRDLDAAYGVGSNIDCLDTTDTWVPSRVLEVQNGELLVHYLGWSDKWDEWIPRTSNRIAPPGKHTKRFSRSKTNGSSPGGKDAKRKR